MRRLDAGALWPAMRRKLPQQLVAVLRGDALGVELHAVDRQLAVLQAHDQAVARSRAVISRQSGRVARSTISE